MFTIRVGFRKIICCCFFHYCAHRKTVFGVLFFFNNTKADIMVKKSFEHCNTPTRIFPCIMESYSRNFKLDSIFLFCKIRRAHKTELIRIFAIIRVHNRSAIYFRHSISYTYVNLKEANFDVCTF